MSVHYSSCILQTMSQFEEVIGIKLRVTLLSKKEKKFMYYVFTCIFFQYLPTMTQ